MRSTRLIAQILFVGLSLSLSTGCAHMVKLTVKPSPLQAETRLPIHAALVLNKDLTDYRFNFNLQGDTWIYPFGTPLKSYARSVADASFQQVDETSSLKEALNNSSADIVLIPHPVKAEQSIGVWAWNKVNFTLIVEWTAIDRASQNTIWLKTLTADASESEGNAFTANSHRRILMQKLFDDLTLKTQEAFEKAPELRKEAH